MVHFGCYGLLRHCERADYHANPKEWMVRTYVVTFAFVFQRVLSDYFPGSRLQPDLDRATSAMWTSWALPQLFTELILQLRRMRSTSITR